MVGITMISVKTSLAAVITAVLALVAYFIANSEIGLSLNQWLPSISIFVTTLALFIMTQIQGTTSETNAMQSIPTVTTTTTSIADAENGIATLYIGNLAYKANEQIVQEFFEKVGTVRSVRLVKDKRTGRRKGFGFIEVNSGDEQMFISNLNEAEFMERNIIVRPANEKQH